MNLGLDIGEFFVFVLQFFCLKLFQSKFLKTTSPIDLWHISPGPRFSRDCVSSRLWDEGILTRRQAACFLPSGLGLWLSGSVSVSPLHTLLYIKSHSQSPGLVYVSLYPMALCCDGLLICLFCLLAYFWSFSLSVAESRPSRPACCTPIYPEHGFLCVCGFILFGVFWLSWRRAFVSFNVFEGF